MDNNDQQQVSQQGVVQSSQLHSCQPLQHLQLQSQQSPPLQHQHQHHHQHQHQHQQQQPQLKQKEESEGQELEQMVGEDGEVIDKEQMIQEQGLEGMAQDKASEKKTSIEPQKNISTHELYQQQFIKGKALKEQGNADFMAGNYQQAVKIYNQSSQFLHLAYFTHGPDTLRAEVIKENIALLNNSSMCYLKMSQFRSAAMVAEEALKLDAGNRKALFRLANAYKGMKDYEKAFQYMKQVVKNGASQDELKLYAEIKKDYASHRKKTNQQDQKLYSNMFSPTKVKKDRPKEKKKILLSWLLGPLSGLAGGLAMWYMGRSKKEILYGSAVVVATGSLMGLALHRLNVGK